MCSCDDCKWNWEIINSRLEIVLFLPMRFAICNRKIFLVALEYDIFPVKRLFCRDENAVVGTITVSLVQQRGPSTRPIIPQTTQASFRWAADEMEKYTRKNLKHTKSGPRTQRAQSFIIDFPALASNTPEWLCLPGLWWRLSKKYKSANIYQSSSSGRGYRRNFNGSIYASPFFPG